MKKKFLIGVILFILSALCKGQLIPHTTRNLKTVRLDTDTLCIGGNCNYNFSSGTQSSSSSSFIKSSISALRSFVSPSTQIRYYTSDLNKEGFWYYDSTDNISSDNTGTIIVSSSGKRFKRIFSGVVNAMWFDVTGLGISDDVIGLQKAVNFCNGLAGSPHGYDSAFLNYECYLPPGRYRVSSAIQFNKIHGSIFRGAGRFATTIFNNTTGNVIETNGCQYTKIEDMQLSSSLTTGVLFNLNWDGTSGPALQSNTFSNLFFSGGGIGTLVGSGGYMGSENLFLNCFWGGCDVGFQTSNFNALQNTIQGGNSQSCRIGFLNNAGNINFYSVGLQNGSGWDIQIINSANDICVIDGCRSESANFVSFNNGVNCLITNCTQLNTSDGVFVRSGGTIEMNHVVSLDGIVEYAGNTTIKNAAFGKDHWLFNSSSTNAYLKLENISTYIYGNTNPLAGLGSGQTSQNELLFGGSFVLGGQATNFINSWQSNSNYLRGANGAFFMAPGSTLSNGNPSSGFLMENPGDNIPRFRNPNGYFRPLFDSSDVTVKTFTSVFKDGVGATGGITLSPSQSNSGGYNSMAIKGTSYFWNGRTGIEFENHTHKIYVLSPIEFYNSVTMGYTAIGSSDAFDGGHDAIHISASNITAMRYASSSYPALNLSGKKVIIRSKSTGAWPDGSNGAAFGNVGLVVDDNKVYVGGSTSDDGSGAVLQVSGNLVATNVLSGTYTPTFTAGYYTSSFIPSVCQYMRVGNVVTVSGIFTAYFSSTSTSTLYMSLPYSTNFTDASQAGGTGGNFKMLAVVSPDLSNHNRVRFDVTTSDTGNLAFTFSFTYSIL